jgi:Mor family transcriptional regulator
MSRAISHEVCRAIGGAGVYLPKDPEFELEQRDLRIWEAFTGANTYQLARQFNLSERQVQFILKHVRKIETERRQPRLPGMETMS